MNRHFRQFAVLCAAAFSLSAHAQLSIEVTGAGANRIPVTIADFGGEPGAARAVTSVIRGDLERSGLFKLVEQAQSPLTEATSIDFNAVRSRGADAIAAGSIGATADGRHEARFRLHDTNKQSQLAGAAFVTSTPLLRAAGHRIADVIYEKLIGEPGIFSTRIAYVVKAGVGRFELQIADADGQNAQAALISKEPIISPVVVAGWRSPRLRVVREQEAGDLRAFAGHRQTHRRRQLQGLELGAGLVAGWPQAGCGADQGRRLADLPDQCRRFRCHASDHFRLDRYRTAVLAGRPDRLLYLGPWRQPADLSRFGERRQHPAGDLRRHLQRDAAPVAGWRSMAFISRRDGGFRLAVMDLASSQVQILTDSHKDESPSFAPNGRMILIATEIGGRGVLSAVSVDGRIKQRLSVAAGDVREPAWGPYQK